MDKFRALLVYLVLPVATSDEGIKAIVDIVQPEASSGNVTFCRLQDVIVVSVQTGSDQLTLNLQRNSAVKENTPVYVVRHVGNSTVIVRDTVLNTEGWQEYLDVANAASIEVSCRITSEDKPQYQLRGFLSLTRGTLYEMTPYNGAPQEAEGPVDDVLYILKPVKPLTDKQTIDITLPYDEADGVSEQKETWWTHESRWKRSTDEIHVDVVAVVDHSVYQRWFTRASQESEALKHTETKENIRRHFAHLINGVDLRFKTASQLYNIHLVGYVIEDQGRGGWFQSVLDEEDNPNKTKIDASYLLPSARDWKHSTQGFPENDHVIVFTAYDLYWMVSDGTEDLLGLAYIGTICKKPRDSISLVEYTDNLVDDLLVTAHEMGHALSARHDGEYNNTCSGADAYITSSSYSSYHNVSITNNFLFSNCSISYFHTFLDQVLATGDATSRNCLLESLEPTSVTNVTGEWPGQLYNVNEQCQMKFGPTSYMCLGTGSTVSVCKRLYCYLPERPGRCRSINAMDGTTCGNRQWCVSGRCVSSADAPEQDSACPFGDQLSHRNMSCPELISPATKHLCYNEFYSESICCDTCRRHEGTDSENCSYGDRIDTCAADIPSQRKNLCYNEKKYNLCCETCTSYKEDIENCSYGDRIDTCAADIPSQRKNLCYNEKKYNLCCETCTSYKEDIENCSYGDRIDTCAADIPSQRKNLCYNEKKYNLCCETCTSYKEDIDNCTYGDRIDTCALDIPPEKKYLCYNKHNFNLCCKTCTAYKGDRGCEYGDGERNMPCFLERCDPSDIAYINTCCATCSASRPVSTSSSTSTLMATSTTSTPTPSISTPTTSKPSSTSTSTSTSTTSTPTPALTSITSTSSSSTTSTSTTSASTTTSTTSSSVPISTAHTTSPSTTTPVSETATSSSGVATQGMRVGGAALILCLLVISLW